MIKKMIRWKPLIIGVIFLLTFYVVSNIISGINISLIGFLLAGTAVGFMVGGNIKDIAINGAIFGVIGGVIVTLLLISHVRHCRIQFCIGRVSW